ncbi:MAG: isochorismatase family protein [Candidatus Nitrosocosmicus sp.]|nr:isochorismatase family protein [Candidatus Nitrosocosmicus sp.]MDN5867176.1 isochorismatase family protein [Candidatus Nitrosocosmicus sp.]
MFPDVDVIKRQGEINAWDDPNFINAVKSTGCKKLIISGILTDVCVTFPTLSAIEAGYDDVAAIYGSGTINQTVREAAISRIIQTGASIMTWFPIMSELQRLEQNHYS